MTINANDRPPAAAATTPSIGQRIETALASAWSGVEAEGRVLLADAEQFGERELGVVENAIVATWNGYEPKAVALIQGFVAAALSRLGSGASIEEIVESVVAQDAAGAASVLGGAVSAGLTAAVAGLVASL
jgi:hypothetical protein